jgi:diacylglycerol kinase (ATP)
VRVLLIYNPTAGEEDVEPTGLVSLLREAGHAVDALSINAEWEDALDGDFDLVAVAGGDGAVAEVLERLAGTGKVAALLPSGSANNIAKSLGYRADDSEEELIRAFDDAKRVRFDLGLVSFKGGEHPFVESAGWGVFADVLVRAEAFDAEPGGDEKIELGLRLLREAAERAPARSCRVVADGADLSGDYIAIEVANVALVSVNVPVAPAAHPGDGLLDLALVRPDDRGKLVDYAIARLQDGAAPPLDFDVRRASRVELHVPPSSPLHLDDELCGSAAERYLLSVGPGLEVLVPS